MYNAVGADRLTPLGSRLIEPRPRNRISTLGPWGPDRALGNVFNHNGENPPQKVWRCGDEPPTKPLSSYPRDNVYFEPPRRSRGARAARTPWGFWDLLGGLCPWEGSCPGERAQECPRSGPTYHIPGPAWTSWRGQVNTINDLLTITDPHSGVEADNRVPDCHQLPRGHRRGSSLLVSPHLLE
jgi:hypothetical protein